MDYIVEGKTAFRMVVASVVGFVGLPRSIVERLLYESL
jgi:hypothetical protein